MQRKKDVSQRHGEREMQEGEPCNLRHKDKGRHEVTEKYCLRVIEQQLHGVKYIQTGTDRTQRLRDRNEKTGGRNRGGDRKIKGGREMERARRQKTE